MSKSILFIFFCLSSCTVYSQNWQQVGSLNNAPIAVLNDTISGLLYLSGGFRLNGTDTIDGFCAYDGNSITSFGRRSDCVSFGCTPAYLIARYGEHIYLSSTSLNIIGGVDVDGIGKWDGTAWSPGMPGLKYTDDNDPSLDSYFIQDGNFYAVGIFRTAEGDTCNSVAYWNGQNWTGLNFPP
ncbi:MAG TPA: hypothetical protein VK168_13370, partial [Saprospiraceae bacterium]|nr:hypothetical protein [Saprospiraceae bacterium]